MKRIIPNTPGGWVPARRAWLQDDRLSAEQVGQLVHLVALEGRPTSHQQLAKRWDCSIRSVQRALVALEALGLVVIDRQPVGSRRYHRYTVVWPEAN